MKTPPKKRYISIQNDTKRHVFEHRKNDLNLFIMRNKQ